MYKITVIVVGGLKESYWRDAEREYIKRLAPYAKYEVRELPEIAFRDANDRDRVLREEGEKILSALPEYGYVVVFAIEGKALSSEGFAQKLQEAGERGGHIFLVIGGSLGLSEAVIARADLALSLSPLTMTHQLARIVGAEQVYRAMTILHGKQYHR